MAPESTSHHTDISLVTLSPEEVEGEANFTLKLRVTCSSACDLWGTHIQLFTEDGALIKEVGFTSFDGTANETDEFALKAPFEPGVYTWKAIFPAQGKKGVLHEESSTAFSFTVKPHALRVMVLDAPSMVVIGDAFTINAGVQCSSGCRLAGNRIAVYSHRGEEMASGVLGEASSPDPTLYCVQLKLKAPDTEGRWWWKIHFPEPGLDISHGEATASFAFSVTKAPEVVLTIIALDKATQTPVQDAEVTIRPFPYKGYHYRCRTDAEGKAIITLPKDRYQVSILSKGRQTLLPDVEVRDDLTLKAELNPIAWEYFY